MSLLGIIIERIIRTGPISVAEYMELALGHPEHGYYMSRDPFGAGGDFVTAPEVSQMFGELLGLWAGVAWRMAGSPESINLVELGPGRGTLMADMLRAARLVDGFYDAVEVHLVETSPLLRDMQERRLAGGPEVAQGARWHRAFADVPEGPLIVIANEFFDALPIEQYFHAGDYWCPRMIDVRPDGDGLCFVLLPPFAAPQLPPGLLDAPADVMVEFCPAGLDIAADIARRVGEYGGAALIVDYGHAESAPGETLQAVKNHQFHDPLVEPGSADLTAHVDFAALAQRVSATGAKALGPITQGRFLTSLGIVERAAALRQKAGPEKAEDIDRDLKRLIGDDQMGGLFKVMAITAATAAPPPPGFEQTGH